MSPPITPRTTPDDTTPDSPVPGTAPGTPPGAAPVSLTRTLRPLLAPLAISIALPLALYYVLRAGGMAQWQALLLSSVVPAGHAVAQAVRTRRAEVFDLLIVALLLVSAGTSLISGSPRVLLLKDAGLPAVLGLWILGTLWAARPFAFRFGERLRGPDGACAAELAWQERPEFRSALRRLTLLWAAGQLLDAVLSTVEALTLPVDAVPVIGRFQSLTLLAVVVVVTVRGSRAFRARHGISLFAPSAPRPGPATADSQGAACGARHDPPGRP
ncbi:VC0807 family protein [Streptomyces sp. NPDC049585]|uniref:VC0807 family protein n=1 Tax=Streptomyces sp. NPDC049585 TaxID=3155154 RepID=UPI0034361426